MTTLEATLLSNAVIVLPLAIVAALMTRVVRRPALVWALWGIVLLKFVTPAALPLPIPDVSLGGEEEQYASVQREDHIRSTGFGPVRSASSDPTSAHKHGLETRATLPLISDHSRAKTDAPAPLDTATETVRNVPPAPRVIESVPVEAGPPVVSAKPATSSPGQKPGFPKKPGFLDQSKTGFEEVSGIIHGLQNAEAERSSADQSAQTRFFTSSPAALTDRRASAPQGGRVSSEANGPAIATRGLPVGQTPPPADDDATATAQGGRVSSEADGPVLAPPTHIADWRTWAWRLWGAGTVLMTLICGWRVVRFLRILRRAEPAAAEIQSLTRALGRELRLRRIPLVRVTTGRVPPLLWAGVLRPTILLPSDLWDSLDEEGRRTLLAHELSHLARRDHLTRWLELAVRCVYWWHPVAWWAGRKLREAEELCCDARVVALLPESAPAYAHTILTTIDYLAGETRRIPTLATGLRPLRRSVRPLHRRLTMIVHDTPPTKTSWLSRLLILCLAAGVLPTALIAKPDDEKATSTKSYKESPEPTADATQAAEPSADKTAADPAQSNLPKESNPVNDGGNTPDTPPQTEKRRESKQVVESGGWDSSPETLINLTRPQALTSPDAYEEISVVAAEYELTRGVVQEMQKFLKEVQDGFPVFAIGYAAKPVAGAGGYGGGSYGGFSGDMMGSQPAGPVQFRVLAPAPAQEALREFLKSMQPERTQNRITGPMPSGRQETNVAKTVTLVRADYEMSSAAAKAFAELLEAFEQAGQVTPLTVRTTGTRLSITTRKEHQDAIRKFISFLSENWEMADASRQNKELAEEFRRQRNRATPVSRDVLEFDLKIAQREVELAKEKLEFTKRLVTKGYKSKTDVEAVEIELLKAQRALKQLEAQLDAAQSVNDATGRAATTVPRDPTRLEADLLDFPDVIEAGRESGGVPVATRRAIEFLKEMKARYPEFDEQADFFSSLFELIAREHQLRREEGSRSPELEDVHRELREKFSAIGLDIKRTRNGVDYLALLLDALRDQSQFKDASRSNTPKAEDTAAAQPPVDSDSERSRYFRQIESIDKQLSRIGKDKMIETIDNRGTDDHRDTEAELEEIRLEAAMSIVPLLEKAGELAKKHGYDHPQVKALHKQSVEQRAAQLEALEALEHHSQTQVSAWNSLGLLFEPLTSEQEKQLQSKFDHSGGLRVAYITPQGPAEAAGIRTGDVLVSLGGIQTASPDDLSKAIGRLFSNEGQIKGVITHALIIRGQEQFAVTLNFRNPRKGAKMEAKPPSSADLDLQIARHELALAEEKVTATKRMIGKGFKTQNDLKAAELDVLKAQRALKQLEAEIKSNEQSQSDRTDMTPEAKDFLKKVKDQEDTRR